MDVCGVDLFVGPGIEDAHGPFVPDLGVRVVSPDGDVDLLALKGLDGVLHWEVHREPTVHAWGVLDGICAVKNFLVELSCEVTCESMELTLLLGDFEHYAIKLLHAC